jgi:4,5-dihydroxyphthalate decarboxylase
MSSLPIALACGPYDRTRALADGRITVAGTELRYITLDPEEVFFRMVTHAEFDVSEMSLGTYVVTRDKAADAGVPAPFVAIPVFPSRMFRHTSVYVNRDRLPATADPDDPDDPAAAARALIGATVGVAEWQLTANVWIRGILAEHYGVPLTSVRYRTGGLNAPGRREKVALSLPPSIDIAPIPAGATLSGLLATGEIDALYSPRAPASFGTETGPVRRLFTDTRAEEESYYAATGIFPIMHVIVIRRPVYEANRWLARELLKAFTAAKQVAYDELARTAALSITLPFVREEHERAVALMGPDYWSYGIEANGHVLSAFARYAADQHLIARILEPADLFAPETGEEFIV